MVERCGAWQHRGDATGGQVEFRVYFPPEADPRVTSIRVGGDFQHHLGDFDWDFGRGLDLSPRSRAGGGTFWEAVTATRLPAGFYQYKYFVEFDGAAPRVVTDPCARYGGLQDQNAAVAVGGSSPAENTVRPLPGGRLPLTDLVIYELMIDDFTAEYRRGRAPLDAVVDRLDQIAAAGFNAVLFMPWTAWTSSDFDWGYGPFQYFSVEARYALDDTAPPSEKLAWLKRLISACHDRDIHVLMDGVFNHVSPQFPYRWLYADPARCPFTAASFGGSFPGLQDLDFSNECTNELVAEVCRYWVDDFGIDGIRFDNTVNFYVDHQLAGLPRLVSTVADHVAAKGEQNFSLTLEHIDMSAVDVTNATAATSFWDNSLYDACFAAMWDGGVGPRLLGALNNRRLLADGKVPTLYLSNHDHSQVAWQAGARANAGSTGGWWRVQPFLIALYTSTAVPLCPNGQEFGGDHFLPEDDHGTSRRVVSRPVQWKYRDDPVGRTLTALHRRLGTVRRSHPALRSALMYPAERADWQTQLDPVGVGFDVARQLAVYHRWAVLEDGVVENVVVVLNFSDQDQVVSTPFPTRGLWEDLLAGFDGSATWSVQVDGDRADVPVGGSWGRILWRLNRG
jgi:hypothetical protein